MSSTVIDTTAVPSCITILPAHIHRDDQPITDAANAAYLHVWPQFDTRKTNCYSGTGSLYSFLYPHCDVGRVKIIGQILGASWIYDDVAEDLPIDEAVDKHAEVRQELDCTKGDRSPSPSGGSEIDKVKGFFRDTSERMLRLDPVGGRVILDILESYFSNYDHVDAAFDTIETYTPYRVQNFGFKLVLALLRWGLDLKDVPAEFKPLEVAAGRAMVLTNDFYSWAKEKNSETDRLRNAIPVIMSQHDIEEEDAQALLKMLILEEEVSMQVAATELLRNPQLKGSPLVDYIESVMLLVGGGCYFSAICPRYNELG